MIVQKRVDWLEQHRVINVLIIMAYTSFLLFGHDVFVNLSVMIMKALSIEVYEKLVAGVIIVFSTVLVAAVYFIARNLYSELRFVVLLAVILLLLVAHFFVLTEMNIEFIHAIMYGLLAMLLFPLIGRFGGAVVAALPVMLFDEWYQHVILHPHYTYFFEFNDVVLDLLGAALFVSILGLFGVESKKKFVPFWQRIEVWTCLGLVVATVALMATCIIVPYADDSCANTWLILNKLPESAEFWYTHPTIGSTFHVLKPMEGLMLTVVLSVAFLGVDKMPASA